MGFAIAGLILDIAVLAGLGAGMFFALHLLKSLESFKNARADMGDMVQTLSHHIDLAQRAVIHLKDGSHETAEDLKTLIKKSRVLMEEMQMINEAGNSLANRLEGLAHKSSRPAAETRSASWFNDEDDEDDLEEFMSAREEEESDSGFSIHDPDYETPAGSAKPEYDQPFKSQAERELYQALMGNRKTKKN